MSSTVNVFVVSLDTHSERRLDLHMTVQQLKVAYSRSIAINLPSGHHTEMLFLQFLVVVRRSSSDHLGQTRVDYRDPCREPSHFVVKFRK